MLRTKTNNKNDHRLIHAVAAQKMEALETASGLTAHGCEHHGYRRMADNQMHIELEGGRWADRPRRATKLTAKRLTATAARNWKTACGELLRGCESSAVWLTTNGYAKNSRTTDGLTAHGCK